jgi:UDP-N-acetylmuramoyl-L-alanyl-D-glutamate--2,6-diaminopimelate ligase
VSAPTSPPGERPEQVEPRPALELLDLLGPSDLTGPPLVGVTLTGVALDSRQVRPGDLYAALPGAHRHGADFVAEAAARGAVAVLTDPTGQPRAVAARLPVLSVPDPRGVLGRVAAWVYGEPATDLTMLGVTGTNGKTTTTYLLDAGLRAAGLTTGLVGTIETRVGDAVLPAVRTTPEAPDLQALFAVMRERGVDAVSMEVSSHALALGRVDGITFDVALFANFGRDHLDFHGGVEEYFAAKASLLVPQRARAAVLNVDEPRLAELAERLRAAGQLPVATYSPAGRAHADWRVGQADGDAAGSAFTLLGPHGRAELTVRLPGAVNVANAAGALVTLVTAGVPLDAAARGLAGLAGVPGRMELVEAGQPFLAVVDYAHTPEAVACLLATLRPLTSGRLIVVVGCGGDRDRSKRPVMGAAAAGAADVAVLTSDNPRSEDPAAILAAVEAGARTVPADRRAELVVEVNRAAAVALAVGLARPGDTVVVAGKGHETSQEAGGTAVPFDDRQVLRDAIARLGTPA